MFREGLNQLFNRGHQSRYEGIDGVRALSILWMVSFHCFYVLGFYTNNQQYTDIHKNPFLAPFTKGHMGVDVFFVISGFLIGHFLMLEFQKNSKVSFHNFFIKRAFRILPVYFLVLGVLILLGSPNANSVWANIIYVNNYLKFENQFMPWAWSLAIEEQFYFFFPFIFVLLHKKLKVPLNAWIGLFGLSFFIRWMTLHYNSVSIELPMHPSINKEMYQTYFDTIYGKTHTRFGGLLVGVIAAYLVTFRGSTEQLNENDKLRKIVLALGLFLILIFVLGNPFNHGWSESSKNIVLASFRNIFSLGVGLIILYLLTPKSKNTLLGRFLGHRFFFPIAQASYSAYLIHLIVISILYKVSLKNPEQLFYLVPLVYILTFFLSGALFIFVERPFLKMRKRYLR